MRVQCTDSTNLSCSTSIDICETARPPVINLGYANAAENIILDVDKPIVAFVWYCNILYLKTHIMHICAHRLNPRSVIGYECKVSPDQLDESAIIYAIAKTPLGCSNDYRFGPFCLYRAIDSAIDCRGLWIRKYLLCCQATMMSVFCDSIESAQNPFSKPPCPAV